MIVLENLSKNEQNLNQAQLKKARKTTAFEPSRPPPTLGHRAAVLATGGLADTRAAELNSSFAAAAAVGQTDEPEGRRRRPVRLPAEQRYLKRQMRQRRTPPPPGRCCSRREKGDDDAAAADAAAAMIRNCVSSVGGASYKWQRFMSGKQRRPQQRISRE